MSLGLASDRVELLRAHDEWATAFETEKARIASAVEGHIANVVHIGSTSIPYVPAKPILDILIGVQNFDSARVCVDPIVALGYTYRGEYGISRRHYFVQGDPRTHHVHMVEVQSEQWESMLAFRDLLRANKKLAGQYAREKIRLAEQHADDRERYQQEKNQVIENILRFAGE